MYIRQNTLFLNEKTTNLLSYHRPQTRVDSPAREFISLLTRLHISVTKFRECVLIVRNARIRHRMELSHR